MKPTQSCQPGSCEDALKPGVHIIVQIVPITPVVSKNFETIRMTGTICGFHLIVSIASTTKDAGSSAMSLGQTIEFLRVFYKQAKHNDGF